MNLDKFKSTLEFIIADTSIDDDKTMPYYLFAQKLIYVAEIAQDLIDNFLCPMDDDACLLYARLDAALKTLE